ncbi:hypothetical protein J4N45_10085 [Vibrio sp. SCSIO 43140]|uniref:hypothetical protein n=1 Tax=Vibrio sp. SCSIO 43140 TaxID=2819100 RepID=UPI0020753AEC|nr:hypothetical protein [Vibrio sp. SCSIO 43140]USD58878.1 hypothetical protein J4N45_10085 [Vibrio sp. SCSIO 43140]
MKTTFIERWKGTQIELGFLAMLIVWASVAGVWALASGHHFAFDVHSIVPKVLNVLETSDFLLLKVGFSMLIVGLIIGFRFVHGKLNVLAKILATLGLFQLLYPLFFLAEAVTTDSRFAQFIMVIVCLMFPVALTTLIVSFLLPKIQNAR